MGEIHWERRGWVARCFRVCIPPDPPMRLLPGSPRSKEDAPWPTESEL